MSVRLAAAISILFLLYTVRLTDARLGMIGCVLSFLGYGLIYGIDRWRRRPNSLLGPAMVLAYPAFFIASIGAVFFVRRIHNLFLGDGSQQASNDARVAQLTNAIPMIVSHPWGHGIAMAAVTLGFRAPDGQITIDSYYLSILLEYGIIGFVVYYGLVALSLYQAGQCWLNGTSTEKEFTLFIPLMLSLFNFCVIKLVLSEEDTHALVFMMLGMIAALAFRLKELRPASSIPIARHAKAPPLIRSALSTRLD